MNRTGAQNPIFLGIDGGGTKCRAVVAGADGVVLGAGIGGPANPFQSFDESLQSICAATAQALSKAGLGPETSRLHACLGLAGVNLPAIHDKLSQWSHPFADLLLATDLRVAFLGAHRGQDGAVIIAGTGSCGYALVHGREIVHGGYGFPCGDQGSGAWIGLQAVQHVLLAFDGLAEGSALTDLLLTESHAGGATALVERLGEHRARDYATLAPLVFSAAAGGDRVATDIIRKGAGYLSDLARRLSAADPPRMTLLGGLAPLMTPWLGSDIAARLSPPLEPPELGSLRLAMQHWRQQQNLD